MKWLVDKAKEVRIRRKLRHHLFTHIEIETDSSCNLRCQSCPVADNPRSRDTLSEELWQSLINQLAELNFKGTLSPHFFNEPLLDPRLEDLLTYARNKLPESYIAIFTNLTALNKEKFVRLQHLVNKFIVTVDEPVIQKAVERFLPQLNANEKQKIELRSIYEVGANNRGGSIQLQGKSQKLARCLLPCDSLVISADGNSHLCCNDYFSKVIFGNVAKKKLGEIWFSKQFMNARVNLYMGRMIYSICKNCQSLSIDKKEKIVEKDKVST